VVSVKRPLEPGVVKALDPLTRDAHQPLRFLHSCSGCFRQERSPGGICTHWSWSWICPVPPRAGDQVAKPLHNFAAFPPPLPCRRPCGATWPPRREPKPQLGCGRRTSGLWGLRCCPRVLRSRPIFRRPTSLPLSFHLHREVVWGFSASFDQLSPVDVVAVGMWATRLRCPSCP
jgi:hypothetical protein